MAKQTFRETLWFKKGDLDAQEAVSAADDAEKIGAVDLLPVEDRYLDDGSVDRDDSAAFGLHTGSTQYLPPVAADVVALDGVVPRRLVRELKGTRHLIAALVASIAALGGLIALQLA
jgi:hypothetical protein